MERNPGRVDGLNGEYVCMIGGYDRIVLTVGVSVT